jgi:hypothetical protein
MLTYAACLTYAEQTGLEEAVRMAQRLRDDNMLLKKDAHALKARDFWRNCTCFTSTKVQILTQKRR